MGLDPHRQLALKWSVSLLRQKGLLKKIQDGHEWEFLLEELAKAGLFDELPDGVDYYIDMDIEGLHKLIQKRDLSSIPTCIDDTTAGQNVRTLATQAGLNEHEVEILAFLVMSKHSDLVPLVAGHYGKLSKSRLCHLIADMLKIDIQAVNHALSPAGSLIKSCLVIITSNQTIFSEKFFLVDDLDDILMDSVLTADELASCFIHPVNDVKHSLTDYSYLKDELSYIVPYLNNSLKGKTKGCNILLYGSPGTGKTELVKTLASNINAELFEVKTHCEYQDQLDPSKRLDSYIFGMRMLENKERCVILFDELEDVFDSSNNVVYRDKAPVKSKAWFNRTLESNSVPTIWTCNSIKSIDKAYLRRFDIIIEMPALPRSDRNRILTQLLASKTIEPEWIQHVSNSIPITAADATRLSKVLRLTGNTTNSQTHATSLLEHSYKASTGNEILLGRSYQSACKEIFNIKWLNASNNMEQLQQALCKQKKGRVCLYGPAGTGKTQFAHHIAQLANMPIVSKKASDLISSLVGETEKNIANAFVRAESEKALLLIDEADTFLSDRRQHQRNWETSQVNEFLVQMEQFDGLFIASTNMMDNLDPASLRRFDFKIAFDYPTESQVWDMFCQTTKDSDPSLKSQVAGIKPLTPGNFKAAKRQAELLDIPLTSNWLIDVLKAEAANNEPFKTNRSIGFTN